MADPRNKLKKSQYYQYPPIEISADDFEEIIFSDVEGYIIGSSENPVTASSISVNFDGAEPGTEVLMFHSSATAPTFDAGDAVVIFREIGSYITSIANPISILYVGGNKLMIVYGNQSTGISDGVDFTSDGVITFDSPTQIDYSGFTWRRAGVLNSSGTVNNVTVPGTPTTYNRIDILEGGSANDAYYKAGVESEDQPFPAITAGRVLLASILRNTDGSNTIEITPPGTSDFVSKSTIGNQTIQSDLSIGAQSGTEKHFYAPDLNGKVVATRSDFAGAYVTKEGVGWSKILEITLDSEFRYVLTLEFTGIESASFEQGLVFIAFDIDGSNDISNNQCKLFGSFNADLYVLVKIDTDKYALFLDQTNAGSFYRFRPIFSFGGEQRYEYFNEEALISPLPAGDQYFFSAQASPSSNNIYTTLQGEVGWAKVATITPDTGALLQYSLVIDLSYISDTEEFLYGNAVVYVEYEVGGAITYLVARVNGNVNPEDFTLVDLPSGEMELYFRHLTTLSEMKFKANILKSGEYIELHDLLEIVASLPAGDEYEFDLIPAGIETVTGTAVDNTDPSNPVIDLPEFSIIDKGVSTSIGLFTPTLTDNGFVPFNIFRNTTYAWLGASYAIRRIIEIELSGYCIIPAGETLTMGIKIGATRYADCVLSGGGSGFNSNWMIRFVLTTSSTAEVKITGLLYGANQNNVAIVNAAENFSIDKTLFIEGQFSSNNVMNAIQSNQIYLRILS